MGRRALDKTRKALSPKTEAWVRQLYVQLQDKDLEKMTLDELAMLVDKSKSTIYTYFTSKEEIYRTAVELVLQELESAIYPELPKDCSMELLYGNALLKISAGINGMSIYFLNQIQSDFPAIWRVIEAFIDRLITSFHMIYAKGMESGEFHTFNTDLLMAMDRHFVLSIITDTSRFEKHQLSLNDLVAEYFELRIRALRVGNKSD